ncbi:MAG: hypothetical protein ACXQTR_04175 [Candidatus Methanospirareceae archaeon]
MSIGLKKIGGERAKKEGAEGGAKKGGKEKMGGKRKCLKSLGGNIQAVPQFIINCDT